MDTEVENAEVLLQKYDNIHNVDFSKNSKSISPVAADLVFIMENAVLNEDIHDDSLREKLDKDSDVEIVEVYRPKKQTIYISSSDEDVLPENIVDKNENISFSKKSIIKGNNVEKICGKVLRRLVWKVDSILQNVTESDENFDSSDAEDINNDQDRLNLRSIIEDEEHVPNYIPKVANEVLPEELEIDKEVIELKEDDTLLAMGIISGVVEKMIVIEANKDTPALDADTALFLEDKKFLGKIFDTFGPVKTPFYSVQLSERINSSKLSKGIKVQFVPFNKDITKYVFLEQLKKLKGSDASWMNDCEPPLQHVDYSDDEEERRAKNNLTRKRQMEREEKNPVAEKSHAAKKEPSKNQRKIQKKRIIDLTRGHNPILEHAKQMNNVSSSKFNQRNDSNQCDIPLSEFLQDNDAASSKQKSLGQEAKLEYVSPLHQSNPNLNRYKGHFRDYGNYGNFSKPSDKNFEQRGSQQNVSQVEPGTRNKQWNKQCNTYDVPQQTSEWQPHQSPYQNRFQQPNQFDGNPQQIPYRLANQRQLESTHGSHNHSLSSNDQPHQLPNGPPNQILHGPQYAPPNHQPNRHWQHGLTNQPPNGPPTQHPHVPPNQHLYGPPNQHLHGPPNQHPCGPPIHPPHGPPNHPPHGPPNQHPHGTPNQHRYGPPIQPSHGPPNQHTLGPPNPPPHQNSHGPPNSWTQRSPFHPTNGSHNHPNNHPDDSPRHRHNIPSNSSPIKGNDYSSHKLPLHSPYAVRANFQQQQQNVQQTKKNDHRLIDDSKQSSNNPYYNSFLEMSYENDKNNNTNNESSRQNARSDENHRYSQNQGSVDRIMGPTHSNEYNSCSQSNPLYNTQHYDQHQSKSNLTDCNQNNGFNGNVIQPNQPNPPYNGGGYYTPPSNPPNMQVPPQRHNYNNQQQQNNQFCNPPYPQQNFGIPNRRPTS